MVNIKIDGKSIAVENGTSIVEAANRLGIKIPTLCYLKEFGATSSCRICVVEVVGKNGLVTACSFPIYEGMEVITDSEKIRKSRKTNLELLLSNHNYDCDNCIRGGNCELETLAKEYDCNALHFAGDKTPSKIDNSSYSIVRDNSKCILCRRCVLACSKRQSVNAIGQSKRGFSTKICSPFDEPLNSSSCVNCGQCILACPTGALHEVRSIDYLKQLLADSSKFVIVAPAPSVRAGLGEAFGLPYGTDTEHLMVAALKKLNFDKVFDVNFGADLTIVEEANEFVERVKNGGVLPMFTSCCPAWVDFVHKFYPEFEKNLSTCKSPQQMFGAIAKTYYAEKAGIDPKNIAVVSIMPCTAKKTELKLPEINGSGHQDVDLSITVRELADFIKENNINFKKLKSENFDTLLGESTGAAVIFGNSGGVMEAALRTVADTLSGEDLKKVDYTAVRGLSGIKEAKLTIAGKNVSVAVASGLANARKLLDNIKSGKVHYDFVEIMSCPGGCINGGGMPLVHSSEQNFGDAKEKRTLALIKNDENKQIRKSHKNSEIVELYKWLGKPGDKKAHKLLHVKHIR